MSSTWALRRFLQWFERRYGGDIPMATGLAAEIVRTDAPIIPPEALHRLLRHEAVAVHVPGFYDPRTARQLGAQLATEARTNTSASTTTNDRPRNWKISTSRGLESSDVTTLGAHVPYNVALTSSSSSSSAAMDEYFAGVQIELQSRRRRQRRRSMPTDRRHTNDDDEDDTDQQHQQQQQQQQQQPYEPQLWPLDLLRLQLDEAWSSGAGLARDSVHHRPLGGGLPRIMHASTTRWKRGLIHVDELGPLDPYQGLFSANIYLQLPLAATTALPLPIPPPIPIPPVPVLQIWPMQIQSRWDWYRHALLLSSLSSPQDADAQGQLRRALGAPLTVAVSPGDLVLFCVQRPHAAIGFGGGTGGGNGSSNVDATTFTSTALSTDWTTSTAATRVSLQCFIQHAGPKKRLLIDC